MSEPAPFRNTADALRFLFNPDRIVCDRPAASRMADKTRGEPGQLSGFDGAATAASAEAMLTGRLTTAQITVLACRYAPSKLRCECKSDCCSGWATNPQWQNAISYIAQEAKLRAFNGVDVVHLRFITAVLRKEYGKDKVAVTDVGTDLGMSAGTCTNHSRRIIGWLLRSEALQQKTKDGKKLPPIPRGIEVTAFIAAEETLRLGGFIE